MTTYVSILRGINVSGKNPIKMNDLKELFNTLGFLSITTYIQSGNVVFQSEIKETHTLETLIFDMIEQVYGYKIPVIVINKNNFIDIVNKTPFLNHKEDQFLHLTFLKTTPNLQDIEVIESKKKEGEEIYVTNQVVYLYCPFGYGTTKLNNTFLEANLKTTATTRNNKTAQALVKLLKQ